MHRYLVVFLFLSQAVTAGVEPTHVQLLSRAKRVCDKSADHAVGFISAWGDEMIFVCEEWSCRGEECSEPNPFVPMKDYHSEGIPLQLFYQAGTKAKPQPVWDFDHVDEVFEPFSASVFGMGLHDTMLMRAPNTIVFAMRGGIALPDGTYREVSTLERTIECGGGKCRRQPVACTIKREDVELPAEQGFIRKMASWTDGEKDYLYFVGRIAFMAAAGDEEMYARLADLMTLPYALPTKPVKDPSEMLLHFRQQVAGALNDVDRLYAAGCGRSTYHPISAELRAEIGRKNLVVQPVFADKQYKGLTVLAVGAEPWGNQYGIEKGDLIVGDSLGGQWMSPEQTSGFLRNFKMREKLSTSGVGLKVMRGIPPLAIELRSKASTPVAHKSLSPHEQLPVVLLRKG